MANDALHRERQAQKKYLMLIDAIREEAKRLGYAIGVHGSLKRDIDLIACPWTAAATPAEELFEALRAKCAELNDGVAFINPNEDDDYHRRGCPGAKPHGRLYWSIQLGGTYIDLSVMPISPALP